MFVGVILLHFVPVLCDIHWERPNERMVVEMDKIDWQFCQCHGFLSALLALGLLLIQSRRREAGVRESVTDGLTYSTNY